MKDMKSGRGSLELLHIFNSVLVDGEHIDRNCFNSSALSLNPLQTMSYCVGNTEQHKGFPQGKDKKPSRNYSFLYNETSAHKTGSFDFVNGTYNKFEYSGNCSSSPDASDCVISRRKSPSNSILDTDVADLLVCVISSDDDDLNLDDLEYGDEQLKNNYINGRSVQSSSHRVPQPSAQNSQSSSHATAVASGLRAQFEKSRSFETNSSIIEASVSDVFGSTTFRAQRQVDTERVSFNVAHHKMSCQDEENVHCRLQSTNRQECKSKLVRYSTPECNENVDPDCLLLFVDEANFTDDDIHSQTEDELLAETEDEMLLQIDAETLSQIEDELFSQTDNEIYFPVQNKIITFQRGNEKQSETEDKIWSPAEDLHSQIEDKIHLQTIYETLYSTESEIDSQTENKINSQREGETVNIFNNSTQSENAHVQHKMCVQLSQCLIVKPETSSSTATEITQQLHKIGDRSNVFQTKKIAGISNKASNQASGTKENRKDQTENATFVSDDPVENCDINNSEWNKMKQLTNDEERYKAVKDCWRSTTVPNPHRDLTHHSYRSMKTGKYDNAVCTKRKRAATSSPKNIQPDKHARRRTASCTMILDKMLGDVSQQFNAERQEQQSLYEERIKNINSVFNMGEKDLTQTYNRNFQSIQYWYDPGPEQINTIEELNYWLYSERNALLYNCRLARQDAKAIFADLKQLTNNNCTITVNNLNKAREEVLKFNQFYCGLHNINPTIIEDKMLEEAERMISMYEKYKEYYCIPHS